MRSRKRHSGNHPKEIDETLQALEQMRIACRRNVGDVIEDAVSEAEEYVWELFRAINLVLSKEQAIALAKFRTHQAVSCRIRDGKVFVPYSDETIPDRPAPPSPETPSTPEGHRREPTPAERQLQSQVFKEVFCSLTKEEVLLLHWRFSEKVQTPQMELGKRIGVTQGRISQLFKSIKRKLGKCIDKNTNKLLRGLFAGSLTTEEMERCLVHISTCKHCATIAAVEVFFRRSHLMPSSPSFTPTVPTSWISQHWNIAIGVLIGLLVPASIGAYLAVGPWPANISDGVAPEISNVENSDTSTQGTSNLDSPGTRLSQWREKMSSNILQGQKQGAIHNDSIIQGQRLVVGRPIEDLLEATPGSKIISSIDNRSIKPFPPCTTPGQAGCLCNHKMDCSSGWCVHPSDHSKEVLLQICRGPMCPADHILAELWEAISGQQLCECTDIPSLEVGACTASCEEGCPPGWQCAQVYSLPGYYERICLPENFHVGENCLEGEYTCYQEGETSLGLYGIGKCVGSRWRLVHSCGRGCVGAKCQ